jgi:hypothetical protein
LGFEKTSWRTPGFLRDQRFAQNTTEILYLMGKANARAGAYPASTMGIYPEAVLLSRISIEK